MADKELKALYDKWKNIGGVFSMWKDGGNWAIKIYDGSERQKNKDSLFREISGNPKLIGTFEKTNFFLEKKKGAAPEIQVQIALKGQIGVTSIKIAKASSFVDEDEVEPTKAPTSAPTTATTTVDVDSDVMDLLSEDMLGEVVETTGDDPFAELAELDLLDGPPDTTETISFVKLQQARLGWVSAHKKATKSLQNLSARVLKDFPEETELAEKIQNAVKTLSIDITETLDDIMNKQGAGADASDSIALARRQIHQLHSEITRSDVLNHLDKNPYKIPVTEPLLQALTKMEKHMEAKAGQDNTPPTATA